jgi:hypothetical protein
MDEKAICQLYELTDENGDAKRGIYVLGSLLDKKERVAVVSQQSRAINLIHSLLTEKRLKARDRICVIGAGAAGLTAAAYAIQKELEVTVLQSCAPLWNLRGCRTRWLHPNLFRWWPEPKWQRTATELPVMNWYADYASNVGDLLLSKYHSFQAMQKSTARLNIVRNIQIQAEASGWYVQWLVRNESGSNETVGQSIFEAVIIAIGFGSEIRSRDTEASVYWLDDTLERDRPTDQKIRYLISGTGDGGLTDLLRIRIDGFRHHHLREALLSLTFAEQDIVRAIQNIEHRARADGAFDPTSDYLALAKDFRLEALLRRLRYTTSVVLANRRSSALMDGAWPISRFLAATLLQHDSAYTQYQSGGVSWEPICPRNIGPPPLQPSHFQVSFEGSNTRDVDAIVVRHGPKKVARAGELIGWVDATLMDFGFPEATIRAARDKWKTVVAREMDTDTLIAPVANEEGHRRSRKATIIPAMGGRTVIGMLSRLVATVGPEHGDAPRMDLKIVEPLVADEAASLLAQLADQVPEKSNASFDFHWRLGPELDRRCAVEVIWAADNWLQTLWNEVDQQYSEVERTWVLPRPPWSKSSAHAWLRNTHVARHWGEWELRYQKVQETEAHRKFTRRGPRLAKEARRLLEDIAIAQEALRRDHMLAIVDLCALRLRVAIFHKPLPRPRRLAGELGAEMLLISEAKKVKWP